MPKVTKSADELPKLGQVSQAMDHALELFTQGKSGLAIEAANETSDRREFILDIVQKSLAEEQQPKAFEIARAVIVEAAHNHMDPLFLLAVISTESQFNIKARGTHGEVGLMQVLPKTAAWLAKENGLPENYNLEEPIVNIRIGAAYFAKLRNSFHHNGRRYVAAYNMGPLNVRRLVAAKTEPGLYPARVLNNYEQLYLSLNTTARVAGASRNLASVR